MTDEKEEVAPSPDIHFEPVISLAEVDVVTLEEDEEELLKLRGKLFRYDTAEGPAEWKERGTGEVKILKHQKKGTYRILMRRDKTLKICANHYIHPWMELKPNCGSEKAWVWSTPADFSDEEPKVELLALRFGNVENAKKFKEKFDECRNLLTEEGDKPESDDEDDDKEEEETDEVTDKLSGLKVGESEAATGDSKSSPVKSAPTSQSVSETKSEISHEPQKK